MIAESAYAAEVELAAAVARRAGELLLERASRIERIDFKSAKDVVTEVDHLSEELIVAAIRDAFPDDGVIGEEGTALPGARDGATARERTWVIDPIDGTINYANGIPFYAVAIGLVDGDRPVAGVIHDPVRGETFAASADGPATLDGVPIAASTKERLSDYVVSMALAGPALTARSRAVRKAIRVPRSMGSAALSLAYVGNGRFDAFVQQGGLSTWDVAAAGLIAERAGATVTNLMGESWFRLAAATRSLGVLAAPPAHHPELLRLIRGG